MEIKIKIPNKILDDVTDAFIYNEKELYKESGKEKKYFLEYFLKRFVKIVYEDYIDNILPVIDQKKIKEKKEIERQERWKNRETIDI